nr:hypothetical protein [Tanacetum cinerariifolium]
ACSGGGCHGGDGSGGWRVVESDVVDLLDRGGSSIFGVRQKSSPEKVFRRRRPAAAARNDGKDGEVRVVLASKLCEGNSVIFCSF